MCQNALTILGSSSALPTSERFTTAQVLQILGRFFLIDCGEGTQIQLRKMKISFSKIQAIFISHLHGDHYLGIFGVLSTFNLLGRKLPLIIYGPPQLEEIVRFHLRVGDHDLSYKLVFKELPNELEAEVYLDKNIRITAFKLKHRISCWGFRFQEIQTEKKIDKDCIVEYDISLSDIVKIKTGEDYIASSGRVISNSELTIYKEPVSYVFVSDTKYLPRIVEYIKGATLLYHEATFDEQFAERAKKTYHSTARQAALIADEACAKQLVIGHFSARYKNLDILLQEAKEVFPNTILAEDLQIYTF